MRIITFLLIVFIIAFLATSHDSNSAVNWKKIPSLQNGIYSMDAVLPRYNPANGEPVYWIVGGPGSNDNLSGLAVYVEPTTIGVYQVPRKDVTGAPEAEFTAHPEIYLAEVRNGKIIMHHR